MPEGYDPRDISVNGTFSKLSNFARPSRKPSPNCPEEFGAAVVLSDLEGLPLKQVAEILEVPLGTVKSRVFRGRRLLAATTREPFRPARLSEG